MLKRFMSVLLLAATSSGVAAAEVNEAFLTRLSKLEPMELMRKTQELQNRTFRMYNKLNDDNYYDVPCEREYNTGSRLGTQVCRPRFEGSNALLFNDALMGGLIADNTGSVPDYSSDEVFTSDRTAYVTDFDSDRAREANKDDYAELANRINAIRKENQRFNKLFEEYQAYQDEMDRR